MLTEKKGNLDLEFGLFFPHNDFGNSSKHCKDPTLQISESVVDSLLDLGVWFDISTTALGNGGRSPPWYI